MAKFDCTGLEEVERQLLLRSEAAVKAVPLMLEAGAKVLIAAQQEEAKKLNISGRSKGALAASIKADKVKGAETSRYIEIYPHGVDRSHTRAGVRNAEKGFVLEYGRSNMPARPWMSAANEKAANDVVSAELEVWEKVNNEGGQGD
jgi:HK97 gp10 family phage protein